MRGIRTIVAAGLAVLLAAPGPASAEDHDIVGNAERIAARLQSRPNAARSGRSATTIATTLALVGGGLGLVLAGNPEFVPSRFAPGNMPRRVDLGMYLGDGSYDGHRYQVVHRRGTAFGTGYGCPTSAHRCVVEARQLVEQYGFGFTDGHDVGRYEGLVAGHEQGFRDGQTALIRIMDADGLVVYEGEFTAASYVQETFRDRRLMRYGGAGLIAAGALLSLFWPQSRHVALTPLPGGGRVAASLGF